jgi:hypothetical protein
MHFQRIMLDKLLDNDTPATEKVCSDYVPRNEEEATQEDLKIFYGVLQNIENHHHIEMSKFALKKSEPGEENGLPFLVPDQKDKPDVVDAPKPKGKKRKPEPPPESGEGSAT